MENERSGMAKILVIGAIAGALTGLGVAYLIIRRAQETGEPAKLSRGEGFRLGMGVLGLMRQVGQRKGEGL
jgi:nitrate reductase gamma subunit